MLHVDFETRSAAKLDKVGVYRYAADPSTEVMCMAYAFNDEPVQIWDALSDPFGYTFPQRVIDASNDGKTTFAAWNANFERVIWNTVLMGRQLDWPMVLPNDRWWCIMADAAAMGLPLKLDLAAKVMLSAQTIGLEEVGKYAPGAKVLAKWCKPRRIVDGVPEWWPKDEASLDELLKYCMHDVELERSIAKKIPRLSAFERRVWLVDCAMNDRGITVDVPMVEGAIQISDEAGRRADAELASLTDGEITAPTQHARFAKFFAREVDTSIVSADKEAMQRILTRDDLTWRTRRVAEIRVEAAKSSAAKLVTMRDASSPVDSRIRGMLQYGAAHTLRWGGRLVQPQNFPRGEIADIERYLDWILAADYEALDVYHAPRHILSAALRSMLTAARGCLLSAFDYSAIEVRVLAWLAGQDDALDRYRNNEDQYVAMASYIFGIPAFQVKKGFHRNLGKNCVLGCFAPDTLVLTLRGWVPLCKIGSEDRVWDGVEWVRHHGVVDQGVKEIVAWEGVQATKDHDVLVQSRWVPIRDILASTRLRRLALATATLPSRGILSACVGGLLRSKLRVRAAMSALSRSTAFAVGVPRAATHALQKRLPKFGRSILATPILSPTYTTENDCLVELERPLTAAKIPTTQGTQDMAGAAFVYARHGETALPVGGPFWNILSPLTDGTTRRLNLTALITSVATSLKTFGSSLVGKICSTSAKLTSCKPRFNDSAKKMRVYDLAECGPRNRYTVLTAAGPIIVHNCGFGMGPDKFKATSARAPYFMDIDDGMAKRAVDGYRELWDKVPLMWRGIENMVLNAVTYPRVKQTWRLLSAVADENWLLVRLPSGRSIYYRAPVVGERDTPWGVPQPSVSVAMVDNVTRQIVREDLWGGLLTENVVQATARELIADAMVKLHDRGVALLLTIHDELVAEAPADDITTLHGAMSECMLDTPHWATGLPIAVEGWIGARYRK